MSESARQPSESDGAPSEGRVLAIGDIHGCDTAFAALLSAMQPRRGDTLVTLGDYVDRGPNSRRVVERLLELRPQTNLVALRGNHEQMMLDARENEDSLGYWAVSGGYETLQSYLDALGERADRSEPLRAVPQSHWGFLQGLPLYHETATHIFVHASYDPGLPMPDQPREELLWSRMMLPIPHVSGKTVIAGHTRQPDGRPRNWGHAVILDTSSYRDGYVTGLDTGSGRIWQADEQGRCHEAHLSDFDDKPDQPW